MKQKPKKMKPIIEEKQDETVPEPEPEKEEGYT